MVGEYFLLLQKPTWIALLDPFALYAPFHHLWLADFGLGLVEKDVLCAANYDDNCGG